MIDYYHYLIIYRKFFKFQYESEINKLDEEFISDINSKLIITLKLLNIIHYVLNIYNGI